jgi:hypothetical protein
MHRHLDELEAQARARPLHEAEIHAVPGAVPGPSPPRRRRPP